MGRAPEIDFTEHDTHLAREYIKEHSQVVLSVALESKELALLNTKSNSTYAVFLTAGRVNNEFPVAVNLDTMAPMHGPGGCSWIAVLEYATSILHLIPAKTLHAYAKMAESNGDQFQGMKIERHPTGPYTYITLNYGWAEGNKIIARSFDMSKGGETYKVYRGLKLVTPEPFAHLHAHSYYSLLDGVAAPEELVEQAMLAGHYGLALTDHGSMHGLYKLYKACQEIENKVKPVFGVEGYLVDDVGRKYVDTKGNARRFEHHVTLIAKDQEGWENLCELVSSASRDHFYYVPRFDHNMLFKHSAGLICLTGCFKGVASHYLQHHDPVISADLPWYQYNPDWVRTVLAEYKKFFGDRLFGECQNIPFPKYMDSVPRMMQMFDDLGIPKVVTNDVHFSVTEDAILQRLLTRINNNRADDLGAESEKKGPYYIKSVPEMATPLFSADMFNRTCEIVDRCTLNFDHKGYLFPAYDMPADTDWAAFQQSRGTR